MKLLRNLLGFPHRPSPIFCQRHWKRVRKFWYQNPDFDLDLLTQGMMLGIDLFYEGVEEQTGERKHWKITPDIGLCCAFDDYTFNGILERSKRSYGQTPVRTNAAS